MIIVAGFCLCVVFKSERSIDDCFRSFARMRAVVYSVFVKIIEIYNIAYWMYSVFVHCLQLFTELSYPTPDNSFHVNYMKVLYVGNSEPVLPVHTGLESVLHFKHIPRCLWFKYGDQFHRNSITTLKTKQI